MSLRRGSRTIIPLMPVVGPLTPPIVITTGIPVPPVRSTVLIARGTTLLLVVIIKTVTLAIRVFWVCTVAKVVRFGALRKATAFRGSKIRQVLTRRATLLNLPSIMPVP